MTDARHWDSHPSTALRMREGVSFAGVDARSTPGFSGSKKRGKALFREQGQELAALQERLYAQGRSGGTRAVLLVLQGMDTSGKGGIARHVLGMVDPQGVDVTGFGAPTEEEQQHHYLWRITRALPTPGRIGVFDRSHYEDVLITRVHSMVPGNPWQERFAEINAYERDLVDAGTVVVKCALAISRTAQLERLASRLQRPDKYWKYDPSDLDERAHWDSYMDAYQAVLDHTSTIHAPWHVIPADRKWFARLAITQLLVEALDSLELSWPAPHYDLNHERARVAALAGQD